MYVGVTCTGSLTSGGGGGAGKTTIEVNQRSGGGDNYLEVGGDNGSALNCARKYKNTSKSRGNLNSVVL